MTGIPFLLVFILAIALMIVMISRWKIHPFLSIMVVDKRETGGYVTPVESAGEDATYVSRIRQDQTLENGLNLWCVSDNLRKGAALNAVQIAELLGNRVLKKG